MAPKGLWRRPRTFEGGPLEPLKGPGDLERPPGIILTPAHPLQAAARRCAGLGTDRPLRGGRQAEGSQGKSRKKSQGVKKHRGCCMKEDLMLESIVQERRKALGMLLRFFEGP